MNLCVNKRAFLFKYVRFLFDQIAINLKEEKCKELERTERAGMMDGIKTSF